MNVRIKGREVSMKKSVCQSLIGITMIFAVACEARADVQILKPDQIVAGHTQLYWAQTWWQWLLSIPAAINPANDPDGRFAANGNNFDVFFLAGTFSPGGTASRTITVPFGKPVFFPVVNSVFAAVNTTCPGPECGAFDPTPCKTPLTVNCAVDTMTGAISRATNMTVQIDNITLNATTPPKIKSFRETSTSFFLVTMPDNNLFGVPPGTYFPGNPVWVQDGYYIMLSNLSLGTHHLQFSGCVPQFSFCLAVTDTLNVTTLSAKPPRRQ
jgi:hypothetical protein